MLAVMCFVGEGNFPAFEIKRKRIERENNTFGPSFKEYLARAFSDGSGINLPAAFGNTLA
jgi:hypothetical protein